MQDLTSSAHLSLRLETISCDGGRGDGGGTVEIAAVTHAFVRSCVFAHGFVCQVRARCHLAPAAQTSVTALLTQHAAGHHQLFTKGGARTWKAKMSERTGNKWQITTRPGEIKMKTWRSHGILLRCGFCRHVAFCLLSPLSGFLSAWMLFDWCCSFTFNW